MTPDDGRDLSALERSVVDAVSADVLVELAKAWSGERV